MGFEKWELVRNPSDKDKNRWRLKLKIDEPDLAALLGSFPGTVGRPFMLENEEYDFAFYLYDLKEEELARINALLAEKCPQNGQGAPAPQAASGSLDSLLDKVAAGIDGAATEAAQTPKPEARDASAPPPATAAPFFELQINPNYTFEEFIIGPNNRFTAAAAQAVADNTGKIYNPFFIYGGVGLGKTHLMHAVGHHVRKKNPSVRVLYVTTEKFMGEVIESIRRGTLQQMRDYYRQVDLLLVDDIQFLVESESTQEEFFHTFNVLHQSGKQIIITSDRPPKQLTTLEDRLRSRFEWGLIADIKSPNLETRVAILKKKGEGERLILDDNILLYIASKLKSNIRELEGFLKRINAYASLTHQEVNMALVQSLMEDLLPSEEEEAAASQPQAAPAAQPRPAVPVPPQAAPPPQQPRPAPSSEPAPRAETPAFSYQPPSQPVQPPPVPTPAKPHYTIDTPPEPPKPAPAAPARPQAPAPAGAQPVDPSEAGLKPVEVGFFYPQGKEEEFGKLKDHFREVIKKHKLKFRLEGLFVQPYEYSDKIDYSFFTQLCKSKDVSIAVVLGPPVESGTAAEDFANLLSTVMDDEKISLQMVSWAELNKDYRYLNLALDITLLKHTK